MVLRQSDRPDGSSRSVNDVLLWLVPQPVLFGAGAASLGGAPTTVGVGVGGVIAAILVGCALFVTAPTRTDIASAGRTIRREAAFPAYPAARLETRDRVGRRTPNCPATRLEALARQ